MNRINNYLEPGTYEHYKGGRYVVTDVITHADGPGGTMVELTDPLVVYRDLIPIKKHIEGKVVEAHQTYAKALSLFKSTVTVAGKQLKRFTLT